MISIPKNSREEIRVYWAEYKGIKYLDVRLYALDKNGEMTPTKKGIGIKPELIKDVVTAIDMMGLG